jgi:hypothetical protein
MAEGALDQVAIFWVAIGLGGGFAVTMVYLAILAFQDVDKGYIGLILLLVIIFFLIAFSFLVAAATPSVSIKVAVCVVDAFVLIGSKLLAPNFLIYVAVDDDDEVPFFKQLIAYNESILPVNESKAGFGVTYAQ